MIRSNAARILVPAVVFVLAGCATTRVATTPATPHAIPAGRLDPVQAFDAALRGVSDANFTAELVNRDAGIIQTAWEETFLRYSAGAPPSRRIRFIIQVDPGGVMVRPMPQACFTTGCRAVHDLDPNGRVMLDHLVSTIQASLEQRALAIAPRGDLELQAAREPVTPRPVGSGPVLLETRDAGHQEVRAGILVEVVLANGNRVSGEVLAVSRDGLVLDVGRDGLVLWKDDIAQVIRR